MLYLCFSVSFYKCANHFKRKMDGKIGEPIERHDCLKGDVIDSCCACYILCRWIVILCCLHIMMSCTSSILCRWIVILCCHHVMMSCACSILCQWVVRLCCIHITTSWACLILCRWVLVLSIQSHYNYFMFKNLLFIHPKLRIRNSTKMGEGLQCCRSSPG